MHSPTLTVAEENLACTEAAADSVYQTVKEDVFLIPFTVLIGGTGIEVGMVSSAPYLARIVQSFTIHLFGTLRAKAVTLLCGIGRAVLVALLASMPWWPGVPETLRPGAIVVALAFLIAFANETHAISLPVWLSHRAGDASMGRFFGRRAQWEGWAGASATLLLIFVSLLIEQEGGPARVAMVSGTMLIAAAVGIVGTILLVGVRSGDVSLGAHAVSFSRRTIQEARKDAFLMAYLKYGVAYGFAYGLSAPFAIAFAVEGLGFGVGGIAALSASWWAGSAVMGPTWGRLSDRFGNRPVLAVCATWSALVPLAWALFTLPKMGVLAVPFTFITGAATAGTVLVARNLILRANPSSERAFRLAFIGGITAAVAVFAPILGGMLIDGSRTSWGLHASYALVFILSGVTRLAALRLVWRIPEQGAQRVREVVPALNRWARGGSLSVRVASLAFRGAALVWKRA